MSERTPQENIPSRQPAGLAHFISELRQRNVFKVAAGYALTGWLVIQLVNAIFPVFDFPRWTIQFVILLVFIGFPIALILAWAFERTPEGLKRSSAVEPAESIANQTGKKLNTYIIATLGTLVVFMLVERVFFAGSAVVRPVVTDAAAEAAVPAMTPDPGLIAATPTSTAVPAISDKTIAVLPFDDFDAGGEEAYFADGLTEEILNALSRTPDLLVASRTSSFQYKDQNVDIREVASALGVAHILEGSVRRSATRLRVTAQLIRASDGFHLWSENYDRDPADIIEVQEDIAFRIATALETAMDPDALRQMVQAGTRSVEAYNDFLKGLAISQEEIAGGGQRQSYDFFEAARQADPAFAAAHSRAADYWLYWLTPTLIRTSPDVPQETVEAMLILFHDRMTLAIENAKLPDQYLYRAVQARVDLRLRASLEYLQSYRRERPNDYVTNDANSHLALASRMGDRELALELIAEMQASSLNNEREYSRIIESYHDLGEYEQGHVFVAEAVARYPFGEGMLLQAHKILLMGAYYDEARELVDRITGTQLPPGSVSLARLRQACADDDAAEAVRIYEQEIRNSGSVNTNWIALHTLNRIPEATALLRPLDQAGSLFPLSAHMVYPFFDVSQYPNLQRVLQREQIVRPTYQPVPYACNREGTAQ